ncbi:hypothetical protein D8Y20_06330 [Mariprofundus sp. EBB-1]|uniref:hypothetical protein n=1 Tax=Mariprofundus sp. EBB-1 TaxID=2650971 RepID=UPI000EF1CDE1|nr:hypothetical protein [Mariprofundus sp. EBB-1]RLL52862.1 hypothetical protein D8Y20_06330 [Mariprofundus sp. EBB-1]
MKKNGYFILSGLLISGCIQSNETPIDEAVNQQLSGLWVNSDNTGKIRFYPDETAKIEFPNNKPSIKLISPYSGIKENTIGIALGGFWSGPLLINTSKIFNNSITVRFPDKEPVTFHKANTQ